ncbi:hypothetical protein J7355_13470 [Endozoicomonas sp. G2_2]|uniref:hypothetical protein n=1 Tax=Endozoicomonas sp. G2_2 TaxID=2821092 RepID=UPI001ADA6531|nr:hypothetical protein [Endozoicomonas sp. G2_2]MBO9471105.1 hypothetical protein [Endozoicomonas sp. G2_2]
MFNAKAVRPLPKDDYRFGDPIVRLPNKIMRQEGIKRREPVMVSHRNDPTGPKVLRFALGLGGGVKGFTNDCIGLDYDAARELGVSADEETDLNVTRASKSEVFMWYWHHDQPVVRMGIRMGALSVVLGVIGALGVAVSIISLF